MQRSALFAFLTSLSLAAGCTASGEGSASPYDGDFPVSDYDTLFADAPDNATLPDENKADAVYPPLNADLVALQSPVKSQGSRGVCSIFSTAALMEHLYLKEGTIAAPDFSEQYLQWSAKVEVGAFPNTAGSNANANLRAISGYGIPEEAAWPYESQQWDGSNDPACEGDEDLPTRCYTNGEPPQSALDAQKYTLPRGRWLSTGSIKAHITGSQTAAIVGLTFFYQSWNHRSSTLPVNSDYWSEGIVLYPNDDDKRISLEKRAGHSILIVGWDDEKEVPVMDAEGNPVVDASGNTVTEKGFYIFKNSWGTGSFGRDNPYGDGYGYLSMRYVEEYGSVYVSDLPTVELAAEICDDGTDNDRDQQIDCDDTDCSDAAVCRTDVQTLTFSSSESLAIPDNDPVGVASTITVAEMASIEDLRVTVNITHAYRGDLTVTLYRGERAVVLHERTGGGQDDLAATFEIADFDGTDMTGEWRLKVDDRAAQDAGTLNGWSLEVLTAAP